MFSFFKFQDQVLLGKKRRGLGKDLLNGFGGKLNKNETIEECAIREVKEECGVDINPNDLEKVAEIKFRFKDSPKLFHNYVFKTTKYSGMISESEEMMEPLWYSKQSLPYEKMWLDQEFWHHLMFRDQKFKADFLLDGFTRVLQYEIRLVDEF